MSLSFAHIQVPAAPDSVDAMLEQLADIQPGQTIEYAVCWGPEVPNLQVARTVYALYLQGKLHPVQRMDGEQGRERTCTYLAVGARPPFVRVLERSERMVSK